MLGAANGSVAFLVTIALFVAVLMAVSRGKRTLRDSLVVRDGRPVLSDEARARLRKRGLDIAEIDNFIAKTYAVNERGEIVTRAESSATEAPAPVAPGARASEPDPFAPPKPEPATGRDSFRSVWEEQDSGPSIWDEADRATFWGDDKKSK
jgi:hypothetical protein